jgi:hypothetical protein
MKARISNYQMKSIIYLTYRPDTGTIARMLTGTPRALRPCCQGGVCVRKHIISAIWKSAAG